MNSSLNCPARWLVMVVLCTWIALGEGTGFAQNYCVNPPPGTGTGSFVLSRSRTCTNLPITVTNSLPGAQNITYDYQYAGQELDKAKLVPATTNTYTAPGSYTILQVGTSSATGFAKCSTITILPVSALDFSARACDNRQVTLTFQFTPETEQYDVVEVDWGDGVRQDYSVANLKAGLASHQYPNTNQRQITVRGKYNGIADCNALVARQAVTPSASTGGIPFISQLITLNETSVQMRIQGPASTKYEVLHKQADGSFKTLSTIEEDGSVPVFGVNTDSPQCFQVRSVSSCAPTTTSEEYCSLALDVKANPGQNNVSWNPYTGASPTIFWRLQRNGLATGIPGNTSKNTQSFTDQNDIRCNTQYCYRLTADAGRTTYISKVVCVTGVSNNPPKTLTDITASVQGNGSVSVRTLDPNPTGSGSYTLLVTRGNDLFGPFNTVGEVANRATFEDATARTADQSYCYQLLLRNECGQLSPPSSPACTIWLTSKSPGALDWTAASPFGPQPVAEYEVIFIDKDTGVERRRQSIGNNTHFEPDRNDPDYSTYRYEIGAISPASQTSRSNPYELQVEAGIFAPAAFSPNSDGVNDFFQVKGNFTDDFKLTVYDRWGSVVYSTTRYQDDAGWDGSMGGQPAPGGTYTWRAEVRDKAGKQTTKASSVLLIR